MRESLAVSVREAARLLSVSERTVWTLAKRGILRSVRVGGRVVFPVSDLKSYLGVDLRPVETAKPNSLSDEEFEELQDLADYLDVKLNLNL